MKKDLEIKVKYLRKHMSKLREIKKGDWIDLSTPELIMLSKGDFFLIPLGVAIQLPEGYEAIIAPRSSTFKNFGIIQTNSIGIIDETYCGDNDELKMPVYATRDVVIPYNTRVCQFRIIKHQPKLYLKEVDTLGNTDRGGFGSTGL